MSIPWSSTTPRMVNSNSQTQNSQLTHPHSTHDTLNDRQHKSVHTHQHPRHSSLTKFSSLINTHQHSSTLSNSNKHWHTLTTLKITKKGQNAKNPPKRQKPPKRAQNGGGSKNPQNGQNPKSQKRSPKLKKMHTPNSDPPLQTTQNTIHMQTASNTDSGAKLGTQVGYSSWVLKLGTQTPKPAP